MNRVYFHQKSDNADQISEYILNVFQSDELYNTISFHKIQINKYLPWEYRGESIDFVYVPVFFENNNYLNYSGVEFALHWYFYLTQQKRPFSIVLLGVESQLAFFKHCKYSNFIKSPNVHYIDYNYDVIKKEEMNIVPKLYSSEEYIKAIKEIQIKPPSSYRTHHSISNEWAIYRWANAIGANDSNIDNIISRIEHQLYFRYLTVIYPVSNIKKITKEQLQINGAKKYNILYIDDEADKGWYEILRKILYDENGFKFDYLGDELKSKTKDEIIELSMSKVINMDAAIVILDFRLHESDFGNDLNDVTGLKILKKIKEYNPGIQVILFSATNKTWNLLELQNAGADGFILKESPENNSNSLTRLTLTSLISTLQKCVIKNFLKNFFINQIDIQRKLNPRRKPQHEKPLPKEFVDEVLKWLQLSNDIFLLGEMNESKIASSFLFKFSVLENISNRIIDVDNPILVEKNEHGANKYRFQFRLSEKRLRSFKEDDNNPGFYRKTKTVFESYRNLPWNVKILNAIDFITDEKLSEVQLTSSIKKRNDFIHANSTMGNKVDITIEDLIFLDDIIILGLNNIV